MNVFGGPVKAWSQVRELVESLEEVRATCNTLRRLRLSGTAKTIEKEAMASLAEDPLCAIIRKLTDSSMDRCDTPLYPHPVSSARPDALCFVD